MADIGEIVAKPREIEILKPDGSDSILGVEVGLRSLDDPKLKAVKRKIQNEGNRLAAKGKSFKAEDIEDNMFEVLFTAMTHWKWYNPTGAEGDDGFDADAAPVFEDEVPDFNRRMVKKVFDKLPWFQKQVKDAVDDETAFFI